ncbi:MAG: hypothetical protein DPW09_08805 [Anaerolineae bacterium]|nr:hypothetical protein [Anaerolineales bacterium]MCQ3973528.1 hypothetical protein [Anaerolineae bacterium]
MKKLVTITFLSVALIGFGIIVAFWLDQLACEGQPINNNEVPTESQQIWGDQIISQSFVAPRNYLNRVDLLFQTYQRQNTHDVTLRLLETQPDSQNPLAGLELFKTTFNAATVSDQSWRTFTFPPINNSEGKTYLITLASPESVEGNAITVGGIERDIFQSGQAFLGPVPLRADITFRACFQLTAGEKLQVLADQMTRNRPVVWGETTFYVVTAVIYLVCLAGFFWRLTRLILG